MIDTQNKNKIIIVGYEQATITQEFKWWIGQEFDTVEIVNPELLVPVEDSAYIISITKVKAERQRAVNMLSNYSLATYVHPSVIMHGNTTVLPGTFIGPNASVYFDAMIGNHCLIGPYSMVSHKTTIGTGTILHPGTMIAGSCKIGEYCLFGMRSTIIDKLDICDNVSIGAGSLVTKSISNPGSYVGSPARKTST